MGLVIASKVRNKLTEKHNVREQDLHECFSNRVKGFLIDTRENNKTDPPTKWFVADNDYNKKLKIVFVEVNGDIHIKTAYEANSDEIRIYNKYAK